MDALGAKPENWEGAGVGGPNQLCFRENQIFEGFLFHYF